MRRAQILETPTASFRKVPSKSCWLRHDVVGEVNPAGGGAVTRPFPNAVSTTCRVQTKKYNQPFPNRLAGLVWFCGSRACRGRANVVMVLRGGQRRSLERLEGAAHDDDDNCA